ncbi:MAG: agmatinase [archaeon]
MAKKTSWGTPFGFLGIETEGTRKPRFSVISVPFDSTASYRSGSKKGPAAIIEASKQVELFDLEFGREICPAIETLPPIETAGASPEENCRRVRETVSQILDEGKIPVVLGGDHSVSIGAIGAFPKDVTVVSIDAHGDLRDSYEGSKFSHACVMKRAFDSGKRLVEFGVRAISAEEAELAEKNPGKITLHFSDEIRKRGISEILKKFAREISGKKVYFSIDIDGFDPAVAPGTGTPEPGGLSYQDGLEIIKTVCTSAEIVGFDINEVIPDENNITTFLAARLIFKIMGHLEMK